MKTKLFLFVFLIAVLTGCESLPDLQILQSTAVVTPGIEPTQPAEAVEPAPDLTTTPSGQTILTLWLPPEFDPNSGTPAGELIKNRLADFEYNQPGVKVETRIKAIDGPSGLLGGLKTSSSAAPLAVPDLIALPGEDLHQAALTGLITPVPGFEQNLSEQDWFGFAFQSARFQEQVFGMPFASSVLMLAYRNDVLEVPPNDWNTVLTSNFPLVFAAADPTASFTLIQYLASGGVVNDENGDAWLNTDVLTDVLTFYQEAEKQGVMPYWLTQYETDDQVWESLQENRTNTAATWSETGPWDSQESLSPTTLPTQNGNPYTTANTWLWAAPSNQNERLELTTRLANHLSDPGFLAQWNQASGQLPVRQAVLDQFAGIENIGVLQMILQSASVPPPADILAVLSPALERATVDVLKRQDEPASAAQNALDTLTGP